MGATLSYAEQYGPEVTDLAAMKTWKDLDAQVKQMNMIVENYRVALAQWEALPVDSSLESRQETFSKTFVTTQATVALGMSMASRVLAILVQGGIIPK